MVENARSEEQAIERVVVRMNSTATGAILGLLCGLVLFIATIWLVLKGGPNPGPHLRLLGQYFPGYSVTVLGSFVGFAYAFVVGFFGGFILGSVYNKLAR